MYKELVYILISVTNSQSWKSFGLWSVVQVESGLVWKFIKGHMAINNYNFLTFWLTNGLTGVIQVNKTTRVQDNTSNLPKRSFCCQPTTVLPLGIFLYACNVTVRVKWNLQPYFHICKSHPRFLWTFYILNWTTILDVISVDFNSKNVYDDEIFGRQDTLQFFSRES